MYTLSKTTYVEETRQGYISTPTSELIANMYCALGVY